jgi:hypothetical protein
MKNLKCRSNKDLISAWGITCLPRHIGMDQISTYMNGWGVDWGKMAEFQGQVFGMIFIILLHCTAGQNIFQI